MSFRVRSSIVLPAARIRRISRSRKTLDHEAATIVAIELTRRRKSPNLVGAAIALLRQSLEANAVGTGSTSSQGVSTWFQLPAWLSRNASSQSKPSGGCAVNDRSMSSGHRMRDTPKRLQTVNVALLVLQGIARRRSSGIKRV